jgi:hypothetical protein
MHDLSNGSDGNNVLLGYVFMGNPHEGENDFTGMYYPVIDFRPRRSHDS